jgi:hypothetical protein
LQRCCYSAGEFDSPQEKINANGLLIHFSKDIRCKPMRYAGLADRTITEKDHLKLPRRGALIIG